MKYVTPSVELIKQQEGFDGAIAIIETAARICYASEPKVDSDPLKFVNALIKRGHTSILRHATIYMVIPKYALENLMSIVTSEYSTFVDSIHTYYVTTNMQVLLDVSRNYIRFSNTVCAIEDIYNDFKDYICEFNRPSANHVKRFTFDVITQVSTSRELNRTSPNNICEQSTRYCNFSDDKFTNQITICEPHWYYCNSRTNKEDEFDKACVNAERSYFALLKYGMKPQDARGVLPLDLATRVFYSFDEIQLNRLFNARLYGKTGTPHPNAKIIASMISDLLYDYKNDLYLLILNKEIDDESCSE